MFILCLSVSAQITPQNTQSGIIPAAEPDNVALSADPKFTKTWSAIARAENKLRTLKNYKSCANVK
jgi:hypothetical protein